MLRVAGIQMLGVMLPATVNDINNKTNLTIWTQIKHCAEFQQ